MNVEVKVETRFMPDESEHYNEYIWSYFITITNNCSNKIKLLSRHWQITDGNNETNEVIGDGVVGIQPIIEPGNSFEYNSFVSLKTSNGIMSGNYTMLSDDKEEFTVLIPSFYLQTNLTIN